MISKKIKKNIKIVEFNLSMKKRYKKKFIPYLIESLFPTLIQYPQIFTSPRITLLKENSKACDPYPRHLYERYNFQVASASPKVI